jgi:hypothetical protein
MGFDGTNLTGDVLSRPFGTSWLGYVIDAILDRANQ